LFPPANLLRSPRYAVGICHSAGTGAFNSMHDEDYLRLIA
jgi:hypothetical protein